MTNLLTFLIAAWAVVLIVETTIKIAAHFM